MSSSQTRREKRERERLLKMEPKKMLATINKKLPKDMKVKLSNQQKEMSYEEWLNTVQVTPEMLKELEEHDKEQRKQSAENIINHYGQSGNKIDFEFEEVKF